MEVKNINHDEKDLHTSLGISRERNTEIAGKIRSLLIGDKGTPSVLLEAVCNAVETPEEAAIYGFIAGKFIREQDRE